MSNQATNPSTVESNQKPSSIVELENLPSMEDLLQAEGVHDFVEGKLIQGKVVEKRDNGVLLDIGYKAEGFVAKEEFSDWADVSVGQQMDVVLETIEDENGTPRLSRQKAEVKKSWEKLVDDYEEGGIIRGIIKHRVRGGLIVDVGVDAFLPGSQIDFGAVKNLDDYLGQENEFKILKINAERRNIVISRREILEQQRASQRQTLMQELEVGQIRAGIVKNITDFGAFVDLNGMDGLLHITDMSWGRISHPSEVVKVGEEIDVMILDVDEERQRVSLGIKQKEGNPWATVDVKYPVNSRIHGRVVNVMPYGAFVELEEGVEGLIHVSEMSWTKRINKASDMLQVGDETDAVILDVQKDAKKISLGLRQTVENPWVKLAEQFPRGSKIKGQVRNMTSYGAFVQIQDDIDGMVHVSDMSWTRKINHPSEMLEKGQEVEAVILDIDPDQQRISLGIKQLHEDPWTSVAARLEVGQTVKGKVVKLASFGAFVELADGIEGLIHISQLSDNRVEQVKDVVTCGAEIEARIIKIDQDERRVGLSLRSAPEIFEDNMSAFNSGGDLQPGEQMVDMGDIFDSAMAFTEQKGKTADPETADSVPDAGESETDSATTEGTVAAEEASIVPSQEDDADNGSEDTSEEPSKS